MKSSSTGVIYGKDIDTYKIWIEYQMTRDMDCSNNEIDHVEPLSLFEVSNGGEL